MNYSEIILLAIALSIDACVCSFSYGLCLDKNKNLNAFLLAFTTGLFQGLMPVIGFIFTNIIKTSIQPYSKYIIFIIFAYLGITFIREGCKNKPVQKLCITLPTLLLIGIATSIDALSSGVTLSLTNSPIIISAIIIGLITFINSLFGFGAGVILKKLNSNYLQILGGLILIGLAIKNIL